MSRSRFFCSASVVAAALSLGWSGAAAAQTARPAAADQPTEVGEVVVTGSFIRGTPEDAALPVDVISQEDIEKQGSPSTLELIKNLSVSSGVLGDTNQFDTRAQGSEGSGSINLRGLGAQRTLVLLNGRRMPPNPFGQAAAGIVDTNLLPQAAIGRVEVLKEGAAATYGSDAIGGVVNFITRQNFDGLEVGGSYRFIDGSKGDYEAQAAWGKTFENGNILLTAGYQHRSRLEALDRDWAIRSFAENPEGGWSSGSSFPGYVPITQTATGQWVPTGTGTAGAFSITDPSCAALGGIPVPGALQACRFHFTEYDNLVERENRYQIYGEVNFDLDDANRFHAEVLYSKTDVPRWQTSPSYLSLQTPTATTNPTVGSLTPGVLAGYFVPSSNPGFAAYRTANPGAIPATATGVHIPGVFYRPLSLGGNPLFPDVDGASVGQRNYEAYRVSGGFKGDLPWGGIGYDVALTYGQDVANRSGYDTVVSRFQLALRGFGSAATDTTGGCTAAETNNFTTNAGNTALGCYYFNPFGNAIASNAVTGQTNPAFNSALANNSDVIRWFFVQGSTKQTTRLVVADAVLNGKLGIELPGGEVGWAAGVQFRRDMFASKYSNINDINEQPCIDTPVTGTTTCGVRNGPLMFLGTGEEQELDRNVMAGFAELAAPITDAIQLQLAARYEDYEAVGSTFNYKATARWQVSDFLAVRGSIGNTFRGPPLTSLTNSSVTALSFIAGAFRAIDFFGNPNLEPEKADTYSVGAIINAGRFKATVDYWRFDFKNPLVGEPSGSIVNTMFPGGAATRCTDPAYAGLRSRFSFSGGTCAQANIQRVRTQVVNGPKIKTSGIDILADYDFGDVMGGELRIGASATYTIEYKYGAFEVEGVVVEPAYDAAGFLNYQLAATSLPEWKGSTFLEYTRDVHNVRFTLNYLDSYVDQRTAPFVTNTAGKKIKSTIIAELDYRVQLPWDTTATLSVDNIFDRDPSFARLDLNYDPFSGNTLGRTYKLSVRKRF